MFYSQSGQLASVADLIAKSSQRPLLVGIDGQGGSGKSTFAHELADSLKISSTVVEGDDFYRDMPNGERVLLGAETGYERYFDWERLRSEVLVPVKIGSSLLRYQQYDWNNERMGSWVEVPMPEIVLVEGIYMLRPQLIDLIDLKLYVRTNERIRIQRQIDRGENSNDWIKRWAASEDYYIASLKPWEQADFIVDGE